MKSKKSLKWKMDRTLVRDFALLLPITALLLKGILGMPWQEAAWASPVVLAGVFAGLYAVLLTLHTLFVLTDKVADRFSIKRSPLA